MWQEGKNVRGWKRDGKGGILFTFPFLSTNNAERVIISWSSALKSQLMVAVKVIKVKIEKPRVHSYSTR